MEDIPVRLSAQREQPVPCASWSDTEAGRATHDGGQDVRVPHHTFSLWNKYQMSARLGFGMGIIHRTDMFAAIDDKVTLPGYTKMDAAVYVRLTEKLRLQAHFENLLNTKFYLNADGNNNTSPGSPRGVRVGLIARF